MSIVNACSGPQPVAQDVPPVEAKVVERCARPLAFQPEPKLDRSCEESLVLHQGQKRVAEELKDDIFNTIRSSRSKKSESGSAKNLGMGTAEGHGSGTRRTPAAEVLVPAAESIPATVSCKENRTRQPVAECSAKSCYVEVPKPGAKEEVKVEKRLIVEIIDGPEKLLENTLEITNAGMAGGISKQNEMVVYFGNTEFKPAVVSNLTR